MKRYKVVQDHKVDENWWIYEKTMLGWKDLYMCCGMEYDTIEYALERARELILEKKREQETAEFSI